MSRAGEGWHLNTPLFTVDHGATQLILSGSLTKVVPDDEPLLDIRATLVRADIPLLQQLLHDDVLERFGAVTAHLAAGRVERAQFQLQTRLLDDEAKTKRVSGRARSSSRRINVPRTLTSS